MSDKWLVLKFGGSSVRGAEQWRAIAALAEERRAGGYRVLLVCSAVEGVTDLLLNIAGRPTDESLLARFVSRHQQLATDLGIDAGQWIGKARDRVAKFAAALQAEALPRTTAELLAVGEWLSTRLGWAYLQKQFEVEWIDARGLLQVQADPERSEARRWLAADCTPGADASMVAGLNACGPVVITQGYVAGMAGGGTALLGRGGSDTSAALLGGRIGAERVEIWTDVPGLFSADPRQVPQARLLRHLDYAEALEMAASGATVVHARCIRAAAATRTPLWIRDTARPHVGGTRIDGDAAQSGCAKAVVCQGGMAALLLQNIDPRQQVGFLAWVFDVIARRGISIDLVATSETTTTVALNSNANHLEPGDLPALTDELRQRCMVELHEDCVTVNLVGRGVRTALAGLTPVFSHFRERPLLMVSQSANDLCLSLLVNRGDTDSLLQAAHEALIACNPDEGIFGPRWQDLQSEGPELSVAGVRA